MPLALFDLDNTLLGGDSDYSWGDFLVQHNIVDPEVYAEANKKFYEEYEQGKLDIHEYSAFSFQPLVENSIEDLEKWRGTFLDERVRPIILPKGQALLDWHRERGDTIVIITATSSFITGPIAKAMGVEHLLATDPEHKDGHFTGKVAGTPCFQEGKVTRLQQWLENQPFDLEGSYFYSDSNNDIPLLEQVTHPVAVDADPKLLKVATERGWEITTFRD